MLVTMSDKELARAQVIQSVCEKRLRRRDAASQLDLSERQVQRLMDKFRFCRIKVASGNMLFFYDVS